MRSEKVFRLRPVRNTPVLVRGASDRKGRLMEEAIVLTRHYAVVGRYYGRM